MAKLTDNELKSICEQEISASAGWSSSELSRQRETAMDAYLGEPYGNEEEGRSQIVTREVLDAVETVLPSIMRILMDVDNAVEFEPRGPEDEKAAEQETDVVSHVVWQLNEGFLNGYTFVKDALISKTGILKVWFDDSPEEEREQYKWLTDLEMGMLDSEPDVEREIVEYELNDDGTHNVTYLTKRKKGKIMIMPCPPEEIGVSRDANSPNIQNAKFVYHRTKRTKSELVEDGYSRKIVEAIPAYDGVTTAEELSRDYLDEQGLSESDYHWSMQEVWVSECYLRVDRNDDGIAELLKVTLAGGSESGLTLLDTEEVDTIPFVSASPVLLTHKFHGLSLADLALDLQKIRTNLVRGIIDNQELANNQRTAVNDEVNLDDLLTSRPGGIVRTAGTQPPQNHIFPIPHQPVPPETYQLLEYLDDERKSRTGVTDMTTLDAKSLSNVNTGVAAMAMDAARMKIELIARIFAEVGFKPLYRLVHELLRKNMDVDMVIRLRGEYVPVHPSEWKERKDMRVKVGIGLTSRERRLMAIDDVLQTHATLYQGGMAGVLVHPLNTYEALVEKAEIMGLGAAAKKYYMDPRMAQPQPEKPDPQMEAVKLNAQAIAMDAQAKRERNQVEMAKIQSQERLRVMEYQAKEQELQLKAQIEALKADLVGMKTGSDEVKAMTQAETKEREMQLNARLEVMQAMLKDSQESNKLAMDQYKAELQTWTQLAAQSAQITAQQAQATEANAQTTQKQAGEASALVMELQESLKEQMERFEALFAEQSKPKRFDVERDEEGNIRTVNGMSVGRDANGLIASIG